MALGAASRPRTLALAGAQSLTSRRAQRSLVFRSVVGRFAAHSSHSSPPPSSRQRPGDVLSLSVHTFFSTPSPAHRVFGCLGPPNRRPFASVSLSPGARFGCTCRRSAPPVGRHRRRRPVHRCGAGSPAPFFFLAKFSVAHCRRRRLVFGGAPAGPRWRLIGFPSDAERRTRRRRRPMWSERCQMPLDSPFVPPGPKNPPRWRPIFAHAMQMRLFSTVHVVLPRCPFPFLLQDAVLMVGVQGGGVRGRPGPKATGAQRWRSFSVQRGVDFGTFSFLIFWFFLAAAAHRFLIASRISMADVHLFSVCVAP